jgi:WD40 repeat protein
MKASFDKRDIIRNIFTFYQLPERIKNVTLLKNAILLQTLISIERWPKVIHTMPHINVICVSSLPDGNFATGSQDKTVRVWNPRNGYECIKVIDVGMVMNAMIFLPNGDLAIGNDMICIYNHADDYKIREVLFNGIFLDFDISNYITCFLIHNNHLISFEEYGSIDIWDYVNNYKLIKSIPGDVPANALLLSDNNIAYSNRSNLIIINGDDYERIATLKGHCQKINWLVELPNRNLVSGSLDKSIKVWSAKDCYMCITTIEDSMIDCISIVYDYYLISTSEDNRVRIWDTRDNFKCVKVLENCSKIYVLFKLPNCDQFLSVGESYIKIWGTE